MAELKLALIHQFGPPWFCDSDVYPVARGDETERANERWAEVAADPATVAAIDADLGLAPDPSPTDEQKVAVYGRWKLLNAIALEPVGDGAYRFDYLAEPKEGATEGSRINGTISPTGTISIEHQTPEGKPNCPICLARGSRIETPGGSVAVEALRIGDAVWTVDGCGQPGRRHGPCPRVRRGHRPDTGWSTWSLPMGGPSRLRPVIRWRTAACFGDLRPGDVVDGSQVARADLVPYAGEATFDIVVSGATGTYFIDGIAAGFDAPPRLQRLGRGRLDPRRAGSGRERAPLLREARLQQLRPVHLLELVPGERGPIQGTRADVPTA